VEGSYENSYSGSGSTKSWEFLELLYNWQPFKTGPASGSHALSVFVFDTTAADT
jgi:hypothetical protein